MKGYPNCKVETTSLGKVKVCLQDDSYAPADPSDGVVKNERFGAANTRYSQRLARGGAQSAHRSAATPNQNHVILYEYEEELNEVKLCLLVTLQGEPMLDETMGGEVPACSGYEEVVQATEEYVTSKEAAKGRVLVPSLRHALDGLGEASTSSSTSLQAPAITQSSNLIEQLVDAYRKLQVRFLVVERVFLGTTKADLLSKYNP